MTETRRIKCHLILSNFWKLSISAFDQGEIIYPPWKYSNILTFFRKRFALAFRTTSIGIQTMFLDIQPYSHWFINTVPKFVCETKLFKRVIELEVELFLKYLIRLFVFQISSLHIFMKIQLLSINVFT